MRRCELMLCETDIFEQNFLALRERMRVSVHERDHNVKQLILIEQLTDINYV